MISNERFNSSRFCEVFNLNRRNIDDNITFSSNKANRCPIQFLDPAENGIKAYAARSRLFSGRKRSGSKRSGSEKCFGSR